MPTTRASLKKDIAHRIRALRNDRTQVEMAHALDTYPANLCNYEKGRHLPRVDFLLTLAMREGVSIDWLLTGEGSMHRR